MEMGAFLTTVRATTMHSCCSYLTFRRVEFRNFVEETEKELLMLFRGIDHNGDGKLSKDELRSALRSAGLAVPNSKLDAFFDEVDTNGDGHISFAEWR
jgi:solute carrier family 25 phosphate transporter 23/24/25/41